ncbi:MAG: hypothetical protein H6732_16045 [Alphaproteobacteria bacterium]|nr:hypothetical protein [Alphaproteobacteria bacterium]
MTSALPSPVTLACSGLLCLASVASAQETVDVGRLKNEDIQVVQDVLYPKTGRLEIGGHLGWLAFDPLVTAPKAELSIDKHFSEALSLSVMVGGGYGFETLGYAELEAPPYNVAPDAYGYLASALVGVTWAPIYAKMASGGKKVVHYDVFFSARGGGTLEYSVIDHTKITGAPTVGLGVGARFFVREDLAVRVEIRDDLMVEWRPTSSAWWFKQNGGVTLGITWFGSRR